MAIFGESPYNELDYQILQNGGISLYRSRPYLEEDIRWLVQNWYIVYRLDCRTLVSETALHENLQNVLGSPACYRRNRNALSDCMSDLVVPQESGAALSSLLTIYTRRAQVPNARTVPRQERKEFWTSLQMHHASCS
jgi:Barstar (barnase inhibitor)